MQNSSGCLFIILITIGYFVVKAIIDSKYSGYIFAGIAGVIFLLIAWRCVYVRLSKNRKATQDNPLDAPGLVHKNPGQYDNQHKCTQPKSLIQDTIPPRNNAEYLNVERRQPFDELSSRGDREITAAGQLNPTQAGLMSASNSFEAKRFGLKALYHITHKSNLSKICECGILSHIDAHSGRHIVEDISNHAVQERRLIKDPIYNKSIHEYAPLYINPRNPMLYVRRERQKELCIIEINLDILDNASFFLITDGNAAAGKTKFYNKCFDLEKLSWDILKATSWVDREDGKRRMCSEFLIYPSVPPEYFDKLHFCSDTCDVGLAEEWRAIIRISPNLFF